METPMVYTVSDAARPKPAGQSLQASKAHAVRAAQRPISSRTSIHWPRAAALGLNTLAWVVIITAVRAFIHR
jgi:hypothetical protein